MNKDTDITEGAIEAIVRPRLKFLKAERELSPNENLGELGLDSMSAIDLLVELEDRFGITIDDESLTENSFASIAEIRALVVESSRVTVVDFETGIR